MHASWALAEPSGSSLEYQAAAASPPLTGQDEHIMSEQPASPPAPTSASPADVEGMILGLAAQEATGCLTITKAGGDEGLVWLRDGQVYSVSVPGPRPLLGVRLITAGAITPEQLNAALELQRAQMTGARLGEVLVHMGLVNRRVVEAFVLEQQRDMLADLLAWHITTTSFRNGARTRTDLSSFVDVSELIAQARVRQGHWNEVLDELGGVEVVPMVTGASSAVALAPSEQVVLRLVNGVRTVTDIADECGFTVFEAADVVRGLIAAGLATTATALLHDPRPAEQELPAVEVVAETVWEEPALATDAVSDYAPQLAEVLELHPEPVMESVETTLADDVIVAEPALAEPTPTLKPSISFEPATVQEPEPVAAAPIVDVFDELPPPSEPAVPTPSWQDPLDTSVPLHSDEPTDTAALMRELTSLGNDGNA